MRPGLKNSPRVKPLGPAEVDWTHPLSQGLAGLWSFTEGGGNTRNLVNMSPAPPQGPDFQWSGGRGGVGKKPTGLEDRLNGTTSAALGGFFTLFAVARRDVSGVTHGLMGRDVNGGPRHFQFRLSATNKVEFIRFNTIPTAYFATGATTFLTGELTMGVRSNSSNIDCWLNGGKDGTGTITGAPSSVDSAVRLALSYDLLTDDSRWNGMIYLCAAWARVLSDEEMRSLHLAPYSMLRPAKRRAWIVSAGGTTPISASDAPALAITDAVSGILAGSTAADTPALSLTEAVSALASSSTVTDAPAFAVSGVVSALDAFSTVADSPTISVSELADLLAILPTATDTPTLSMSETAAVAVTLPAADSPALSLADAVAGLVSSSALSDSPAISITDLVTLLSAFTTVTDSPTISIAELASLVCQSAASDAITFSFVETALIAAVLGGSDSWGFSFAELSTVVKTDVGTTWTPIVPPSTVWTPAGSPNTTWTPQVPPSTTWS